jgi:hypothetical protein
MPDRVGNGTFLDNLGEAILKPIPSGMPVINLPSLFGYQVCGFVQPIRLSNN